MGVDSPSKANEQDINESKKSNFSRALLASVAIGVAGSFIIVPLTYLQMVATLAHSYAVAATLGLWVIPCLLPLILVKRGGSAIIACAAIGVISAVTTPFGMSAIPALLFEGLIVEIPFLVTLYRKWSTLQYFVSSVLLGGLMGYMVPTTLGISESGLGLPLSCMAISTVSSLAGTWLSLFIAKKIQHRGVLIISSEATHM